MPLILKGVQCWEDALEAYDRGLAGVVLSNHGGRQLEFSRSGVETLVEVVRELKARRGLTFPNEKFQLFVDGGVRRATDVLKAIALGATAGACVRFCLTYNTLMGMFDSWYWPAIFVRLLGIWSRGCRACSPNPSCKHLCAHSPRQLAHKVE